MFSPWILLGVVVGSLGLGVIGYFKGDADAANRYQVRIDKMQIAARDAAEADQQKRQKIFMESAQNYEVGNAAARVRTRTILQGVDHLVEGPARVLYSSTCIDDAGLVLVNAALAGIAVTAPDPAQPNGGMPRPLSPQ